jgi:hypothetical protein
MTPEEIAEKLIKLKDDVDRYKKECKKQKQETDAKNATLNDKVNTLGTQLENTKTDLIHNEK